MKILLRAYLRGEMEILDSKTGEVILTKEKSEDLYIFEGKTLKKMEKLPDQAFYLFCADVNDGCVAVYGQSPENLKKFSLDCSYDVFCFKLNEKPNLHVAMYNELLGGSTSEMYMDKAIPEWQNGKIMLTCEMHYMQLVAHKTHKAYIAKWHYNGRIWLKEPWKLEKTYRGW